jgi:YesN/AraC family two-component response regulator
MSVSILLCEDDSSALQYMASTIKLLYPGSAVFLASDGLTGLQRFKEHLPDIVITDVNMPEMNGIEMLAAIKAVKEETKTILITAYGDKTVKDVAGIGEVHVDHCIHKPLEYKKLFEVIDLYSAGERGRRAVS